MPFCPQCRYEYHPGTEQCPDCRVPLVETLPPDPRQWEQFETVELCKVSDEMTGLALQAFLLDAGIGLNLRDMRASFYGNVLSGIQGYWGTAIVTKEDEPQARKLYAEFLKDFEKK